MSIPQETNTQENLYLNPLTHKLRKAKLSLFKSYVYVCTYGSGSVFRRFGHGSDRENPGKISGKLRRINNNYSKLS